MAGKRATYTAYDRDQVQAWKKAIAARDRQQRNRRGKRRTGIDRADGPGMIRLPPPRHDNTKIGNSVPSSNAQRPTGAS
jgi:hypothetical protein